MTLLVAASIRVGPAVAQTDASVSGGVGTVRYPGGTTFGSAILSPAFRYSAPTVTIDGSGALASLPGSVLSSQGRASVWAATLPFAVNVRAGGDVTAAGTTLNRGLGSTAELHGVAELLWEEKGAGWGVGLGAGPSTGMISGASPVVALHTRLRAWGRPGSAPDAPDMQFLVEPTRFPEGWFTDASVAATLERAHTVVSFYVAGRISSTYGSKGAGSMFVQWFVRPRVSVEVGGGSALSDPYQALPRTGFITLGVRLHASPRRDPETAVPRWGPLIAELRGDSVVVRFRLKAARSVAIAGDWNVWKPLKLRALGDDLWQGAFVLRHGLYHFNLLVDGSDWVVPNGVATVSDGLGGMVAVLIVP